MIVTMIRRQSARNTLVDQIYLFQGVGVGGHSFQAVWRLSMTRSSRIAAVGVHLLTDPPGFRYRDSKNPFNLGVVRRSVERLVTTIPQKPESDVPTTRN